MAEKDWRASRFAECGLYQSQRDAAVTPIPLVSVTVNASVIHSVSNVEVTQVYVNREDKPIEAIYYFPIDSNGAVTLFEAQVGGRKIKGIAKANEEAEEEYERAVNANKFAVLGEENKPDIFKVRVGSLKPGKEAKIVIGYTSEVKNEKGTNSTRFYIPTTIAPRYVPAGSEETEDKKSTGSRAMKFAQFSSVPLSIKVEVSLQGNINSITSPTHAIRVTNNNKVPGRQSWSRAEVELKGQTTDMDRDFVLLITPADSHTPKLYTEKCGNSLAIMVHLIPSFKLEEQRCEFIFLVDRSGSMAGKSIYFARKALVLLLHSLPVDCYFNIVGFGSSYKFLFSKRCVRYDDSSLKNAVSYAYGMGADMGGTEMLDPLKAIYALEPVPGYFRQIFVLTDGELETTDQVIGLTRAKAHESRVFALGIGAAVSHHLIDGLAKAGGGTSAFVTYNESIDTKVVHQLNDALRPALTNVRLTWKGVKGEVPVEAPEDVTEMSQDKTLLGYGKPVMGADHKARREKITRAEHLYQQSPPSIPPLYDGTQLLAFGLFENLAEGPTGLVITADTPQAGQLSIEIPLSPENNVETKGLLHKLAVIKIIREIEEKILGCAQDNSRDFEQEREYKSWIVGLAVMEGLASKYTSFVATDILEEEEANGAKVGEVCRIVRQVPSQVAYGHSGSFTPASLPLSDSDDDPEPTTKASRRKLLDRFLLEKWDTRSSADMERCYGTPYIKKVGNRGVSDPSSVSSSSDGDCAVVQSFNPDDNKNPTKGSPYTLGGSSVEQGLSEVIKLEEDDLLNRLLYFQSFDGFFKWDKDLLEVMGLSAASVKLEAEKQKWDLTAWSTALTLAFFNINLKEESERWELVGNKAQTWLRNNWSNVAAAMETAATAYLRRYTELTKKDELTEVAQAGTFPAFESILNEVEALTKDAAHA